MCEQPDPRAEYLGRLQAELRAQGLGSELVAANLIPRLRLDMPWGCSGEFQDNIVASPEPDGIWRFWWPWAQAIAPAGDVPQAAGNICRNRTGDEEDGRTTCHGIPQPAGRA